MAIQEGEPSRANGLRCLAGRPTLCPLSGEGQQGHHRAAAAVAVLGRAKLSGFPAWLARLFVHIIYLIGFRNRFLVLFQ